jgi:peptidyl-prolyl cis-trans isomerase A (cyclophilin A)
MLSAKRAVGKQPPSTPPAEHTAFRPTEDFRYFSPMRFFPLLLLLASSLASGCSPSDPGKEVSNESAPATVAETESAPQANSTEPLPDTVRVRLETRAGPITLELDAKRAPITTANFIRYVDAQRFDGTTFYRAARSKYAPEEGFIQGGIRRNYRLMYEPIAHEPTSKTGLRHVAGTISMARSETPGVGAMGDFFIITHAIPDMDATADEPGYATFGKVIDGMPTVRKILASPTSKGGRGAMKGQMLERPVLIEKAVRID